MDVIVVGAGMGGLSAAIQLAAQGARVTVLEKNDRIGGKLGTWKKDGFTFDTGPHVLTMPWAFEEVFAAAGRTLRTEVSLVPLETICRYHFPGGAQKAFDAVADPQAAAQALAAIFPGEEEGFRRFLAYAQQVSEATTDPFLRQDFGASVRGVPSRVQWKQLGRFLALQPWRTLRDVVQQCFSDPQLRQIFELYALYSGSHPARCSGIFATVADVQWRQGTYYIQGGLAKLGEALAGCLKEVGADLRLVTPVREVIVKNGQARGVVTSTGERYFADAVVCNADCLTALTTLVPLASRHKWPSSRVNRIEPSTSAFLLLLGVEGVYPQLAHHNAFLASSADQEYTDIFERHRPADDPTVGISCQSVTDPSVAPAGCSSLFIMTNPPALHENFDWQKEALHYRERVLNKLEAMGLTDLRQRIRVEQMWTPPDLESKYGSWRGAIYGLSSNGWRNGFLRPPQVSPDVARLYFVGGSTHPGGGLPLCVLSGTNVARKVLSAAGWLEAGHQRRGNRGASRV